VGWPRRALPDRMDGKGRSSLLYWGWPAANGPWPGRAGRGVDAPRARRPVPDRRGKASVFPPSPLTPPKSRPAWVFFGGPWSTGVIMADTTDFPPEIEGAFWRLYRDFFDKAEKRRRWSIRDDIPWDRCNPRVDPAVADVVESFCAVELYLPD